jgi:hypothetical protein
LSGHLAIEGKELDMHTFAEKTKVTQQTTYAKPTISGRARFGQIPEVRSILQSRRAIGNQTVQPLLQTKPDGLEAISSTKEVTGFADDFSQIPVNHESSANVQAKLTVGPPGDIYEQEADRVSENVVRMPEPQLQRACTRGGGWPNWQAEQSDQVHERIQNKRVGSGDPRQTAVPPMVHDVLRSSGQALDAPTRAFMEPRFGRDFSRVRVHPDAAAEQSARDLNANAYTVGHHIVFGAGRLAPGTDEGRRLIAHELTHVVQQCRLAPFIQREPRGKKSDTPPNREELAQYKSTDPVVELKPVVKPEVDAWELTVKGDFTTPAAVGRLIWPTRDQIPPGVSIKPIFVVEVEARRTGQEGKLPTGPIQQATFELTGIALFTLVKMDPLFAKMFADLGLIEESESIRAAREDFRARHSDLGDTVLNNIDAALKRVTRNNPGLLEAFYRFYSSDWKLTDDIESSSSNAGNTDQGLKNPNGYTDLNAGVLHLRKLPQLPTDAVLSLLGTTLIHEYAHTSHARDYLKGPGEGKAYGIENFFNERLGDTERDKATSDLGSRMGDKMAFDTSYFVMKQLYEVIDGRLSKLPSLKGVSVQRAREMSVEFISKDKKDFGQQLKLFILTEAGQYGYSGQAAYDSLPSKEKS